MNIGSGKAKDGGDYPALYVVGSMASGSGIYRSTDQGATWDKIVDYPLGIFDTIDAIDGDKDLIGQVYLSFTSTGFGYGKPAAE
ncbi:MAG: hypothetical protein B7Z37_19590 [Verrucomicrobia bacterium 12-59-8]|nr:MAG: hypothetical protein B7Z37_19590 [Verrucomicrobia bacterium 12-59-8]